MTFGLGVTVAIVGAIVAIVSGGDVLAGFVVGGFIGMIFGWLGDSAPAEDIHTEKSKRGIERRNASRANGVRDNITYHPPARSTELVKRTEDFSRLEVPGGYVPFEMTRTEKKTKNYLKTETTIKTYIDPDDLPTVLSHSSTMYLSNGGCDRRQLTALSIEPDKTYKGDTYYRMRLEDGSRANVFQHDPQAFSVVDRAYRNSRRGSNDLAIPLHALAVTTETNGRFQNVKAAQELRAECAYLGNGVGGM